MKRRRVYQGEGEGFLLIIPSNEKQRALSKVLLRENFQKAHRYPYGVRRRALRAKVRFNSQRLDWPAISSFRSTTFFFLFYFISFHPTFAFILFIFSPIDWGLDTMQILTWSNARVGTQHCFPVPVLFRTASCRIMISLRCDMHDCIMQISVSVSANANANAKKGKGPAMKIIWYGTEDRGRNLSCLIR